MRGKRTRGIGKPATYSHWVNMKTRCFNKNNPKYKNYGARGITICEDWLTFENFHKWAVTHGFKEGLTIDRINNDGNYCPENCRWVTNLEQAKNKQNTIRITYKGITDSLQGWTKRLSFKKNTLRVRITKLKWSVEKAFNTPVKSYKRT